MSISEQLLEKLEPRKIFLGFLITRLMEVEEAIYNSKPLQTHSIIMMQGIVDSLSEIDKKALTELDSKLDYMRNSSATDKEIEGAYRKLSSYLHVTYLQESFNKRLDKAAFEGLEKQP